MTLDELKNLRFAIRQIRARLIPEVVTDSHGQAVYFAAASRYQAGHYANIS